MKTLVGAIVLISLLILGSPYTFAQGFSGTIHYRNGESVPFNHIGDMNRVYSTKIEGKFGAKAVTYSFHEFSEIIFADKENYYGGSGTSGPHDRGTIVVVNRHGERFTLTECHAGGSITYTYNDPITKSLKVSTARIQNNISHITVGKHVGDMKYNPNTKEYFPAMYVFDPFTGEKLVWAKKETE